MDGVNSEAIEALVLAAGEGSRLRKYAKQKTLCYTMGVPLLGRILLGLKEAGISRVYIVIGYEGDKIRREIGEKYAELDITYITSQNWEKGNLYSFLAAKGIFKKDFILCMGDHIFDSQIVKNLINVNLNGALVLAIDRVGYASDDTKVQEHDGRILNIGKHINPSNCVDTGFFLCSPKIFSYAEGSVKQGASELADCIRLVAQNGDAQVFDISGHYWVDVDTKKDVKRAKKYLIKNVQKRNHFAAYYNAPVEDKIASLISNYLSITPNRVSIFTNIFAYCVTLLFLMGYLLPASILTFFISILDGVDGKLARLKHMETRLGALEHSFDFLWETSWIIAFSLALSNTLGNLPLLLCLVILLFDFFNRHIFVQFKIVMKKDLRSCSKVDRIFCLVDGRRNTYLWYILIGVLLNMPIYSLIAILIHAIITSIVYTLRCVYHARH